MNRVHIIGQKSSGKTTLIVDLVSALTQLGYRVGTIKHTHHQHELDTPGKDSHRHREAGAAVVGILSRKMNAVFWPPEEDDKPSDTDPYVKFGPMFEQCDLVLVEGDMHTHRCKIEVWRHEIGIPPLAKTDGSITAIVTDDQVPLDIPIWPRKDVTALAKKVIAAGTK